MTNETVIFDSPLHLPPGRDCDFCRDGLIPPLTHDFAFLGAVLAIWPEGRPLLLLKAPNEESPAFRFGTDDGLLLPPLSGRRAHDEERRVCGAFAYDELRRIFVTRFFQFRLIQARQQRLGSSAAVFADTEIQWNEELCDEYEAGLHFRCCATEAEAPHDSSVYCPMDGWIDAEIEELRFGNRASVVYLVCPDCSGNIDYVVRKKGSY